jgi:YidC/Oxa1 family membrane protein insertase
LPIMIAAGIATHFNSRASVARQSPEAAANPQTAMMNRLALYVFPVGVVAFGPVLPIAILLYWFANNIWTFGQQHYVFGHIEKEEEAKKLAEIERRASNAPPPGAKPKRGRKGEASSSDGAAPDSFEVTESGASELAADGDSGGGGGSKPSPNGGSNRTPRPGAPPRPGARPKKRKR